MGRRTPFYEFHVQSNAKIVDFAGWDMPLHYGSQINEHHEVRQNAGLFDISHMGVVDIKGDDAANYLRYLLANNIDRLKIGQALYTCMLNERGGIIDDLIVYKIGDDFFRMVVNAGTREKDIAWMQQHVKPFAVDLVERDDLIMFALQGPKAQTALSGTLSSEAFNQLSQTKPFHFMLFKQGMIARTGYTGEDGYEFILPHQAALALWRELIKKGVKPCGLGARDTLRLEAGLNLYGSDMNENVSPLESNLAWTVAFQPEERRFIGREALQTAMTQGVKDRLVGLILEGPGIMRNHQPVIFADHQLGEITSGGYSPTLEKSIAFARVPLNSEPSCFVEIRQKQIPARIVALPFVRKGKKVYTD